MRPTRTYLDHNATTPIHPDARAAMNVAFDCIGNPSSIHAEGRAARAMIDAARREVADLVGAAPDDVFFTSGGTEALNMILTPELTSAAGPTEVLLVGAGEHPAVLAGHRFTPERVETIATTTDGRLDLDALDAALARHAGRRVMLALQAANNETGVIQPVAEAAAMVHSRGGFVACDAVQAAGKIDSAIMGLGADAMAVSGHKFGGPKGVGALIFGGSRHHLRDGVVRGGGQERGLRSGTENLSGIAGLGAAARFAQGWRTRIDQLTAWRKTIEGIIGTHVPEAVIFGHRVERLPNTVTFAAPGLDARVLLMNLDLGGVAVSAGSACSAGKAKPSRVLEAMGAPATLAGSATRISLGWTTTQEDITRFAAVFAEAVARLGARASRAAA